MENKNTQHIEDDFLGNLVKKSETSQPSDGFTNNLMAQIPKVRTIETTENEGIKPWHYVGLAAVFIAVVYFIVTFDLNSLVNKVASSESQEGINYVGIFGNILLTFSKAFSAFHFTSISLMIVISVIILYFADKMLKKWSKNKSEATFA
jgi:hypothetical protein